MDKISKLSERVRVLEKSVLWCLHLRRNPLRENLTLFINTVFLPFFLNFEFCSTQVKSTLVIAVTNTSLSPELTELSLGWSHVTTSWGKATKTKSIKCLDSLTTRQLLFPLRLPFPFPSQIPLPGSEMLWMGLWVHISNFHFIAARVNLNEQTVNWAQGALPSPAPRETSNECNYEFIDKVPFLAAVVAKCIQCTRTICCVSRGEGTQLLLRRSLLIFYVRTWWQWQLKTAEAR